MILLQDIKVTKISDPTSAGSTDVESDILDMAGYETVVFMTSFGTAATDNTFKARGAATNSSAALADLAGTLTAPGASDEDVSECLVRPQLRFVQAYVTRGTSTTVGDIWAVQFGARYRPVTNTIAGTILTKTVVEPIAGTA